MREIEYWKGVVNLRKENQAVTIEKLTHFIAEKDKAIEKVYSPEIQLKEIGKMRKKVLKNAYDLSTKLRLAQEEIGKIHQAGQRLNSMKLMPLRKSFKIHRMAL